MIIIICWWWYVCVRRRGPSITHYTGSRAVWLDENEDIDIRWLIFTTQQVWGKRKVDDDDAEILLLLIYSPTDWILTHSEAPDLIDWSRPWTKARWCLPEMILSHHSRPLIGLLIIFQMGPHDLTVLLPGDILGVPYYFNLPDPSVWPSLDENTLIEKSFSIFITSRPIHAHIMSLKSSLLLFITHILDLRFQQELRLTLAKSQA